MYDARNKNQNVEEDGRVVIMYKHVTQDTLEVHEQRIIQFGA